MARRCPNYRMPGRPPGDHQRGHRGSAKYPRSKETGRGQGAQDSRVHSAAPTSLRDIARHPSRAACAALPGEGPIQSSILRLDLRVQISVKRTLRAPHTYLPQVISVGNSRSGGEWALSTDLFRSRCPSRTRQSSPHSRRRHRHDQYSWGIVRRTPSLLAEASSPA